ncbi:MAG TPA: ABC transporter permease [Thermoanaerobaculia bacterium]|nr:ABC transporter permease [Thermoanaerobaculia bacterium]
MFTENLKIALVAIWANKMRSILTVLGVMIGVAAVIAVVSIVQGLQHKISNDLADIGSNFIQVFPDPGEQRNPFLQKMPDLTFEDAEAVRRGTTSIRDFTPIFLTSAQTKAGDARHSVQLSAVGPSYQEILNHWVEHGRFFTAVDEEQRKRVCTIGIDAARDLNLGDNPIGKMVQVDNNTFTVVGVMEKKGGTFGNNQDDVLLIPFSTAAVLYGSENMRKLVLAFQMEEGADIELAKDQVRQVLRTRHRLKKEDKDDFRILAQEELLKTTSSILGGVSMVMGGIVGIALLVGGIGIMNIMLVSVTERTREIGIRKSLGARRGDVLIQFLIEAVVLSGFGGAVGVLGGTLMAMLTRAILSRWTDLPPVHTPLVAIIGAFAFCALIGIIFGIYPAAKASKLDPIEALRYE